MQSKSLTKRCESIWAVSCLAAALTFTVISGCSGRDEPNAKPPADLQTPVQVNPTNLQEPVQVNSADLQELVKGNNEFAFDLYARLAKKEGNKFFSPYSISTALGMTYAGARENTAKEMAQTLHFTLDNERLHPAFGELIRKVNGADNKRNYELAVANSLWANKTDLSLDPKFFRIAQADYQADFQFVDFVNDAEGARRTINGWVEEKTNNKITDLFQRGGIGTNTRLVLVNAIYFKGDWAVAFPKAATRPDDFTDHGRPAFKVPMMNHAFDAHYMENAEFQLAQFAYKDNEVSMVVILPKKRDGLPDVEKKLSAKALEQTLSLARPALLQVALPKFKMTEEFSLRGQLEKLGMKDAFGAADFTGMDQSGSLSISEVVHKAFVDVDEKGTEAAAATGVTLVESEDIPIPFRADHPFLFLLRHNVTGSILFMGRVSDPRGN